MSKQQKQPEAAKADTEPQLPAVVAAPAQPSRALTLDLSVQDLLRQKRAIAEMMKEVLIEGTHYGPSFPGDTKKTLHQPGADALIVAFGLVPRFDVKREDIEVAGEGMHREYTITCTLFTRSGQELGSGIGSCSTMESKYRWRNARPKCPSCQHEGSLIRTKGGRNPGGWWCVPDKGGCGNNYDKGERDVEGQALGKVPHADIADTYNTILKLGAKRAKVAATILITGCADMFTQDLEEQEDDGDAPHRQEQSKAAANRPPTAPVNAAPVNAAPVNAAPVNAAPGTMNAVTPTVNSTPASVNAPADVDAELTTAYQNLKVAASSPIAAKVWKRWAAKDQKSERLDAIRRMTAAIAAINARLGSKAERLLADLTFDRTDPDNVDGMLADLEKAAGVAAMRATNAVPDKPAPTAVDDEPPF